MLFGVWTAERRCAARLGPGPMIGAREALAADMVDAFVPATNRLTDDAEPGMTGTGERLDSRTWHCLEQSTMEGAWKWGHLDRAQMDIRDPASLVHSCRSALKLGWGHSVSQRASG